jgi:Phage tail assembly chaperone proteins, E, or 41 or 14
MTTTVKLTTPVEAYGDQITEITFRPPTGKDIRKTGLPNNTVQEEGVTVSRVDMEAIAKLIILLGNVPSGTVDAMTIVDYMACAKAVSDFFGTSEETKTSSRDITTSPGSGASTRKKS